MEYPVKKKTSGKAFLRVGLCIGILLFLSTGARGQTLHTRFLKKLAADDLYYLRDGLKALHPNPFTYTDEKVFDRFVEQEVMALKDTVDYFTLRTSIRRITYFIHCVHTTVLLRKLTPGETPEREPYLPLEVRCIRNRFYVLKNYSEDTTLIPGTEILSINGHSVTRIMDTLKTYRSGDGTGVEFMQGLINLPFQFNFLYRLYFLNDSAFTVVALDSSGNKWPVDLQAIDEPPEPTLRTDSAEYDWIDRSGNVWLRLVDASTAVLQVKDFGGDQLRSYKHVFRKIKEAKVQYLVLDLRSNYGGSMGNANALMSYLISSTVGFRLETPLKLNDLDYYDGVGRIQRLGGLFYFSCIDPGIGFLNKNKWYWQNYVDPAPQYHFAGKLYVLINEHTLSASSYIASQLKHKAGAVLLGTPSGGGEFGNAGYTYASFTLPNSRSRVKVPHNWINYEINTDTNGALVPQYIVYPNIKDVIAKKDVLMDSTLKIIRATR